MSALQNSATTNWPDSWPSHQSNWPLTVMGPSGATPPSGREAENGSASGVFRQDEVYEVGIDRRPLLTSLRAKRSEEHTSELQSLMRISYAVFCLKKKQRTTEDNVERHNRITPTPNEST